MDLNSFEAKIVSKIERNKSCSKAIKENQKLIEENYVKSNLDGIKSFVNKINDAILQAKKYDEAEKFLKTPCMSEVLEAFRESDILIRACEGKNKKATKWLVSMKVNPNASDEKGMTALMHACTYWDMESVVVDLLKLNIDQINVTDKNGNTPLFHAVKVKAIFDKLIKNKIDTNHRNNDGDTLFTYICRCHKPKVLSSLIENHDDVDFSVANNDGRTGLMYLAESDNFTEIRKLAKKYDLNVNYKSKKNETVVSLTINRLFDSFKNSQFKEGPMTYDFEAKTARGSKDQINGTFIARTINALIDIGCDFNCTIDGDGNTPLMFFLFIKDYVSALNLLQYCKTMDLNKCNKYGVSAAALATNLKESDFSSVKNIKDHLFVKVNYQIFQNELTNYPTYSPKLAKEIKLVDGYMSITPYSTPEKLLTLMSALSEGYFARSGEDGDMGIIEQSIGNVLLQPANHPF